MAAEFQPKIFTCGAMSEGNVVICDVVEEVDFIFPKEEAGGDGVDWSVAPSFVEETTVFVKSFEKVDVGL